MSLLSSIPYCCSPWPLLPRKNHQLQTAPVLFPSSEPCLLCPQGLSWLRSSSPLRNWWVSVEWWATVFTKHVDILTRGFNQKSNFSKADFRCFVMTSQQDSIFFSPKGMTLWLFLSTACVGVRPTGYLETSASWNCLTLSTVRTLITIFFFFFQDVDTRVFETKSPTL